MLEQAIIVKIFLASPNDVKPERELIFTLKDDLDHLIGKPNKIRFEFVNWERTAYPGIGQDAQDVINQNIKDDYNIFIGIFWQRFGTPTNRAESGTKEEFDRAINKYNSDPESTHIMLYFKTAPPDNIYDLDYSQFEKVKSFKNELQEEGILYWEFNKTDDLKNNLLLHLSSLVRDKFSGNEKQAVLQEPNQTSIEFNKYDILAKEVDEGREVSIEGILELIELASDSMSKLPIVSENITGIVTFIGEKFIDKNKQLKAIEYINDNRLRLKKATTIMNNLALDLNRYSEELNEKLPDFRENLNVAVESYAKLLLSASESSIFINEVESQMKTVVPELENSLDESLVAIAEFLNSLKEIPSLTSKFGNSKRKAELSTNELFKEFINAKKIMKQLIEENWNK